MANEPLEGFPRLSFGDTIKFKRKHIVDILWDEDKEEPDSVSLAPNPEDGVA